MTDIQNEISHQPRTIVPSPSSTRDVPAGDAGVQAAVVAELAWTPGVDASHVGVSVLDGAVTLSGEVSSYPEKLAAERAVQRVAGVRAVALEMTVRSPYGATTDSDIAHEAAQAIERSVDVPSLAVQVTVHDHVVTLVGTVPANFQREAASRAVRTLRGVHDVQNQMRVRPTASTTDIKSSIAVALARSASLSAERCSVTSDGKGTVTLDGVVDSWSERRQMEQVAYAAPGVSVVRNQLHVEN